MDTPTKPFVRPLPLLMTLLFLDAGLSLSAAAQEHSFRILATGVGSRGVTLSADGSRVGFAIQSSLHSAGASAYVRRTSDITGRALFETGGPEGTTAPVLSADGRIARGMNIESYSSDLSGSRLWEYSGGPIQLLPGAAPYEPVALSDDGSVTVGNNGGVAFRTTGGFNGAATPLGDLDGGGSQTRARDVSGDGAIVVGVGSSVLGGEAFRWQAGNMMPLGDLDGGIFESEANGISRDGSTIVGFGTGAAGREAVRWRDGEMERLGMLSGDASSIAHAASLDGSTIVGVSRGSQSGSRRPFIWDEANGMRDLAVLLALAGVDLQGVSLDTALQISSDGRTIAGMGSIPSDFSGPQVVVWIATVPEPSTAILVGLGLAMLGARRGTSRSL